MNDALGRRLRQWRMNTVLPQISGRFLDIGCGHNDVVKAYKASGRGDGTGVDVYPWEGCDLVVEDTAKLPFQNGEFDTVAIIAALNHIPNRGDVLKECARVLKPGGRIILTMLGPGVSKVWHFLRRPWDEDQTERGMKDGEVWGLTRRQIHQLLTDAGFTVDREKGFMLGLNKLTVAVKK
jgi:ubiquinone/menaquinone biosynthesis C-methylase UbiE